MPEISVIMPVYNCGPFVATAIESILNQTYTDFELVICDDGSVDNSWDVIQTYTDKRIRKYRNEINRGVLFTYNYLLSLTTGKLITCQDADDWSDVRRLEVQRDVFDKHPDIYLCGINGAFCNSESVIVPGLPFESGYVTNTGKPFPFILPAILYRSEVLEKVKGWHPYFDRLTSMDQYFIMDILANYKAYALNECLYYFRFNVGSNHRTFVPGRKLTAHEAFLLLQRQRMATGSDWLLENRSDELLRYEESLLGNRKYMAEKYREYGAYLVDGGLVSRAMPLLWKALIMDPASGTTYRTLFYMVRKFIAG